MFKFNDLESKVVVITGSGRGIGREIAENFAKQKAKVVITDINKEISDNVAQEIKTKYGVETLSLAADVSNKSDVDALFKTVMEKLTKVDILVNNAGITMDTLFMRMKEEQFRKVIDVNLTGTYLASHAAFSHMRKARTGNIINISSIAAHGNIGQANYSASKAGVEGLTKALAKELAAFNVRVNAIAPGFIKTEMTDKMPEDIKKRIIDAVPLKRAGEVTDIANTVLYLASEISSYVTGEVISVNGGLLVL